MFYWHLRLPGVKTSAHLEPHPIDNDRVGTPGASGFAHLRVGGFATGRSIGTYDFQVRKTHRTWNRIGLTMIELVLQVRTDLHTLMRCFILLVKWLIISVLIGVK